MSHFTNHRYKIYLIALLVIGAFSLYFFASGSNGCARLSFLNGLVKTQDPILELDVYKDYSEDYYYLNQGYNGQKAIVFLGDSITRRFNLREYFPGSSILNRGIFFDTTLGVMNRLETNVNNLDVEKLFLLIGYNDLQYRTDEEILDNISTILFNLKAEKVYLQSIIPVGKKRKVDNLRIIKLNNSLKETCSMPGCYYIDLHKYFIEDENGMPQKYSRDGVHPNSKGYRLWAGIITQILDARE